MMIKKTLFFLTNLFLLFLIWQLSLGVVHLLKAGEIVHRKEKQTEELTLQNQDLKKRLEESAGERFVEESAREKLGMARTGEVVVVMPEELPQSDSPKTELKGENLPNWKCWWNLFLK